MNSNTQNAGNGSVQIIGSNNTIFNFFKKQEYYRIISEIAKEIVQNFNGFEEMNIDKIPAEILEKIEYNEIPNHKNSFIESIPYLPKIEFIIEKVYGKKSEIVINRIKYNWNKTCSINPTESKDNKLFLLSELIIEKIKKSIINKYGLEIIEISVDLIIFYVFTKCQILDNPN